MPEKDGSEATRNDDGSIQQVVYADLSNYTIDVQKSPLDGRIRITTRGSSGNGVPTDLTREAARRFSHDLEAMAGEEGS